MVRLKPYRNCIVLIFISLVFGMASWARKKGSASRERAKRLLSDAQQSGEDQGVDIGFSEPSFEVKEIPGIKITKGEIMKIEQESPGDETPQGRIPTSIGELIAADPSDFLDTGKESETPAPKKKKKKKEEEEAEQEDEGGQDDGGVDDDPTTEAIRRRKEMDKLLDQQPPIPKKMTKGLLGQKVSRKAGMSRVAEMNPAYSDDFIDYGEEDVLASPIPRQVRFEGGGREEEEGEEPDDEEENEAEEEEEEKPGTVELIRKTIGDPFVTPGNRGVGPSWAAVAGMVVMYCLGVGGAKATTSLIIGMIAVAVAGLLTTANRLENIILDGLLVTGSYYAGYGTKQMVSYGMKKYGKNPKKEEKED